MSKCIGHSPPIQDIRDERISASDHQGFAPDTICHFSMQRFWGTPSVLNALNPGLPLCVTPHSIRDALHLLPGAMNGLDVRQQNRAKFFTCLNLLPRIFFSVGNQQIGFEGGNCVYFQALGASNLWNSSNGRIWMNTKFGSPDQLIRCPDVPDPFRQAWHTTDNSHGTKVDTF